MFYKLVEFLNNKKNFPYYFISPLIYSYGNSAEQIYLISGEKFLKNRKIIILNYGYLTKILKYKISNKNLLSDLEINGQSQKKNKIILQILGFAIFFEFFIKRFFVLYFFDFFKIKINELKRFPYLGLEKLYSFNDNLNFKNVEKIVLAQSKIILDQDAKKKCQAMLKDYNLDSKKIVTLHVRDSKYKDDYSKRNYRNSDINNYIKMIKFLISKDYIVFRLGTSPCSKINFEDPNFIDYPELDLQSSLLDLYLVEQSEFFIGTGSGPRAVAEMFSIPILITNSDDFSDMPLKNMDRVLFKKFFLKENNNPLSIMELLNSEYNLYDPELYLNNFNLVENTSEELLSAGKEFLLNLSNKKFELNEQQEEFNKILKKKIQYFYTESDNNTFKYHIETLRYIKRCKTMEGSICQSSLKKRILNDGL
jgi:putative glycosyltransferase (TIGR04372 family)